MKVYIHEDEFWPVYLAMPESEAGRYEQSNPGLYVPAELTDEEQALVTAGWKAYGEMQELLQRKMNEGRPKR